VTDLPSPEWDDAALIGACIAGHQGAWDALILKYQNLVWAIIRRSGAASGEEEDVFQSVWLDAYNELQNLRNRESLQAWIATVARHKCYHWRSKRQRWPQGLDENWADSIPDQRALPQESLERLERDQQIRLAIFALQPECRELLSRLFLSDPPRPYREVAEELGMAIGSIGSLRARCLERLKEELVRRGLA